jgi:hypothetical protein
MMPKLGEVEEKGSRERSGFAPSRLNKVASPSFCGCSRHLSSSTITLEILHPGILLSGSAEEHQQWLG